MQNYLSLLFAVTTSVLTTSSTAISARTALLNSVEFYLTFIQTEEILLSVSPHIFIGLDLYFPHWMIHLKSSMNCSALKACQNAELILKKVFGESRAWRIRTSFCNIQGMTNLSRYLAMSVSQTAPKTPWLWSDHPSVLLKQAGGNFHTLMRTNFILSFLSLPAFTVGLIALYREPSFWLF